MSNKYTLFPSCCFESFGVACCMSLREVCDALGIELDALEDWNCCGSTAYFAIDELLSFCLSARNLALAEQKGHDLVTGCSACYTVLRKTETYTKQYPEVRAKVDEALAAGGLKYERKVRTRHIAEVLFRDVGVEKITSKMVHNLQGLKVATYYGCQTIRPEVGFDHPEFPQSLGTLVEALGGEAIAFPLMSRCCGGSLIMSGQDIALGLLYKLLKSATENGAQIMTTTCPLCQFNLDAYQGMVNSKYHTNFNLPVLYFTQVIGLALGIEAKALGIDKNIVPAVELMAAYA